MQLSDLPIYTHCDGQATLREYTRKGYLLVNQHSGDGRILDTQGTAFGVVVHVGHSKELINNEEFVAYHSPEGTVSFKHPCMHICMTLMLPLIIFLHRPNTAN